MKSLYLYIVVVLLAINSISAQNLQNANWYYGHGLGLHFNGGSPTTSLLPSPINSFGDSYLNLHCHTTVSDTDGNLLFFSDGRSIFQLWNGTYQTIATLLPDDNVYESNRIVSIPKPNDLSKYFIVMQKTLGASGSLSGLQYSEIDLSNGLAQMTSLNVSLNDNLNNVINSNYNLGSSALTSTVHADGENYWVISHVKNQNYSRILSYKVTETGIEPVPSSNFIFSNIYSYEMKISPDAKKIAIATEDGVYLGDFDNATGNISMALNPIGATNNFPYSDLEFSPNSNYLYYGRFESGLGIYAIDTMNSVNEIIITQSGDLTGMQLAIDGKIYVASYGFSLSVINNPNNINDPQLSINSITTGPWPEDGLPQWVHQQAIDPCNETIETSHANGLLSWNDVGGPYIIEAVADDSGCEIANTHEGPLTAPYHLQTHVFNTNDNSISVEEIISAMHFSAFRFRIKTNCGWSDWCCFDYEAVASGQATYPFEFENGSCFYAEQPCNADFDLIITEAVLTGENVLEQATNTITATNTINSGAIVDYHAVNAVFLAPGFIAQSGSDFLAHIEECTYIESSSLNNRYALKESDPYEKENFLNKEIKNDYVIISPNPSSSIVNISLENLMMNNINVTSIDGRIMFNKSINDTNSYKLDISNYYKGIYIVTVSTVNGKIITDKIIKN